MLLNQPSLGLLKVVGSSCVRVGKQQQEEDAAALGIEGLWLKNESSWRAEVEEGSRAGMEEARASGEGVGVSAAGAALPGGIQAPTPLGKRGRNCSGNVQFVRP